MHCTLLLLKRLNMVFAIGKTHGHGLSNKMRPWLQSKKTEVCCISCYNCCSSLVLKMGVSYSWLVL